LSFFSELRREKSSAREIIEEQLFVRVNLRIGRTAGAETPNAGRRKVRSFIFSTGSGLNLPERKTSRH
jgi:hypothetical protein